MNMDVSAKPTLVLLPGWAADRRTWSALVRELEGRFALVFLDLPYPESGSDAEVSLESLTRHFIEQIPPSSMLLGWSLGGMLALHIAQSCPEKVAGVVTIASNLKFVADTAWPNAMPRRDFEEFKELFRTSPLKALSRFCSLQAKGHQNPKEITKKLRACNLVTENNHNAAVRMLELLDRICLIGITRFARPSLFIMGEHDAVCPPGCVNEIQQKRNCTVRIVSGTGHAPHMTEPDKINEALTEFADQVTHGRFANPDRFFKSKKSVASSFAQAADSYDSVAHVQRAVATKLCKWAPDLGGLVLDAGCGTGFCSELLANRKNVKKIVAMDLAPAMLKKARERGGEIHTVAGDIESLPFPAGKFDAIVSSLAVQWCDTLTSVFAEANRVLVPGGYFLVSSLGPKTLYELAESWASADPQNVHVNRFSDSQEVQEAASSANFQLALFGSETLVQRYDEARELMRELKALGAHNINNGSKKGLTGKSTLRRVYAAYDSFRRQGTLPATYQVQYWLFTSRAN